MSRINGSDALKMFEAYAAVYTSQEQEITEEQIWEEVENWVNSLLEEGYDLSDYTWEEMYEEYLNELTAFGAGGGNAAVKTLMDKGVRGTEANRRTSAAGERELSRQKSIGGTGGAKGRTVPTFQGAGGNRDLLRTRQDAFIKGAQAARGGNKNLLKPTLQGAGGDVNLFRTRQDAYIRGGVAAKNKDKSTSAGSDAGNGNDRGRGESLDQNKIKPSKPTTPTPGTKAAGPESIKPKTPNPLLAGGDIRRMQQASQMRQSGINVTSSQLAAAERTKPSTPTPPVKAATPSQAISAAPKPSAAASGSLAPATASIAAKPSSAMSQDAIRKQRLNMEMEYDAYDLVLEYLLDNGHAETVDEAHYIMLEMDAQMVGDIVEGSAELSAAARKRAEELGRKRRSTKAYKQGLNRGTGRNERAAYNLSNIQRTHAANPSTQVSRSKKPAGYDTGAHKGDYERFNRSKPEKNPKHDANK